MKSSPCRFIIMASLALASATFLQIGPGLYAQNQPAQVQQYKMAVIRANTQPFKVDIRPETQGVVPGSATVVRVELRSATNEPVKATQPTLLIITATPPRGPQQIMKLEIPAYASSSDIRLTLEQAGLWKLEAREAGDHLKTGSNYLMVSSAPPPAAQVQTGNAKKGRPMNMKKTAPRPKAVPPGAFLFRPRLVNAAYVLPAQGPGDTPAESPQHGVIVKVSGEGDGRVRADGKSSAHVLVFLLSPQSRPVRAWLAVSAGQLEQPMLTIPAGELEGEVLWRSNTVVTKATVKISEMDPQIQGWAAAGDSVDFVDPIVGIGFANPPSKMNIVEKQTLAVLFIGEDGKPTESHLPVSYTFSVNSPHLNLFPATDQTRPGVMGFTTEVTASALGNVTLEAAVPGLQPVSQPIQVTGMFLLLFCALGGAAGGFVNHTDRKIRGLFASLLIAMIASLPITWLYVWVGLPNTSSALLHNQLSAVMVAIVGGIGGASMLKGVARLAGLQLFGDFGNKDAAAQGKAAVGKA